MDHSGTTSAGTAISGGNGVVNSQVNDIPSPALGDSKQNLNEVINSIQKTPGLLLQLYLIVSSFNADFQLPLFQRINSLVMELDNMAKFSESLSGLIDDGKNPDEFTKDVINSWIAKNQITKGKTDAFKGLSKQLLEELELTFPDEVEAYREIRAASATESRRLTLQQSVLQNGDMKIKPHPY